jgi:hypothetical protein
MALRIQEMAEISILGYHYDAGHAWLKVSYDGWNDAPFNTCPSPLRFASKFSYVNTSQQVVYLEEDADMPAYLDYYDVNNINTVPNVEEGDESPIRRLPRGKAEVLPELSAE